MLRRYGHHLIRGPQPQNLLVQYRHYSVKSILPLGFSFLVVQRKVRSSHSGQCVESQYRNTASLTSWAHSIIPEKGKINHSSDTDLSSLLTGTDINRLLEAVQRVDSSTLDYSRILDTIDRFVADLPPQDFNNLLRENPDLELHLEVSWSKSHTRLDLDSPYYNSLYPSVNSMHKLLSIIYPYVHSNERFQQQFAWTSYHVNDFVALKSLFLEIQKTSPKISKVNPKTLAYIISAFISSHDVEQAKSIFNTIVNMSLPGLLNVVLLEAVMNQLVTADALFENVVYFYNRWVDTRCTRPSARCLSILLDQHHRYGTDAEMKNLKREIQDWDCEYHHEIALMNWKHEIYKRNRFARFAMLQQQDFDRFCIIISKIRYHEDLAFAYRFALKFFAHCSSTTLLEQLIAKISQDKAWDISFYIFVCEFYALRGEFILLYKFLSSVREHVLFNTVYLEMLHRAFVLAYPFRAPQFSLRLQQHVQGSALLPPRVKEKLSDNLKIVKLKSQVTPYHVENKVFREKASKYSGHVWKSNHWHEDSFGRLSSFQNESRFRITRGFLEIIARGVMPDARILTETFRRSNLDGKQMITVLCKRLRIYHDHEGDLAFFALQVGNPTREILKNVASDLAPRISTRSRLALCRMLANKNLHRDATQILESIEDEDLTNNQKLIKMIVSLRNSLADGNVKNIPELIKKFDIDKVMLSPFFYNQCCHLERKLVKRFETISKIASRSTKSRDQDMYQQYAVAIPKMQGLIGDISVRLEKDSKDLDRTQIEMHDFLEAWARERYSA